MATGFHKILIPVDFSFSTEIAVKKAIGLMDRGDTLIHLLHVIKDPALPQSWLGQILPSGKRAAAYRKYMVREAGIKLDQWKRTIEDSQPGVKVTTSVLPGPSISGLIIESSKIWGADLIIIGRQGEPSRFRFFPTLSPDRIARKSNCPVLTVKPGSIHSPTKIIVVPVQDYVPERKLELAVQIARKYRAHIHLLTFRKKDKPGNGVQGQAFLQTYHRLRNDLHHPVEHFSSPIANPAKAVLDYAELIMADLVLVNPDTESGIPSLAGSRHISDLLSRDSKIQVLDVKPYSKAGSRSNYPLRRPCPGRLR